MKSFPEQPPTEQDQESDQIPKARYNPNESLALAGQVKKSEFHVLSTRNREGSKQAVFACTRANGLIVKVRSERYVSLDDSLKLEPQFAMHETTSELARTKRY